MRGWISETILVAARSTAGGSSSTAARTRPGVITCTKRKVPEAKVRGSTEGFQCEGVTGPLEFIAALRPDRASAARRRRVGCPRGRVRAPGVISHQPKVPEAKIRGSPEGFSGF
jgi:hypothetical protein